ncbi:MAG: sigma-70 family RNA polymerase sigma factor, partial [Actinobacteria bacterium]|nr:sigma-70 family RNA polymerase sigma factor [Actinomycetota bacterium]
MATTADGALVEAARAGDERAFGQLFDAWFDRVHDVSRRIVRDDGIAAEVAQDAFLRAWTKLHTLDDVDAFGGWVLRIGRNASLNRLEKERRSTVVDDDAMTRLTDATSPDHDPLAELDQAGRVALVWDAAAALGERDASVLDLHLRHGLGAAELAEELGTNANNAHQVLFTLRKRLGNAVRALVLWRAGHPTCADLRSSLASAGLTSFGAPMVKAIDRHVDRCDECADDRTERLRPAALFAAAPIVAAPTLLKAKAAAALGDAGVPMAGSSSASASAAGAAGGAPGVAGPSATPFADPGAPAGAVGGAIGGGSGGDGAGPEQLASPADGSGDARSASARRRLVAAVVLVVACLGGAAWWASGAGDDDEVVAAAAPGSTV